MPKKKKGGDGGGGGKEKEKLPGEDIQTYITKIDALQGKMDAMMRASEDATSGHEAAKKALEKERLDRKDNVDYLQAELAKRKAENDALKEKYVQLEEAKEAQAKRLGGQLEKAQETMQKQEQQLQARADEVAQLNDNLIELGQLKTNAAADVTLKGSMSSELESLRFKLNESQQQLTVLAMADGREGGQDGERVLPLLLLELLRLYPGRAVLCEQTMIALQYVLSSDRHADAELIRSRGGVKLILDVMSSHETVGDLLSSACGLLWKLAFADPEVRVEADKANGIAIVMGAMQRHAGHPRLHYNACGALRHLLVTAPRNFPVSSQLVDLKAAQLPPIASGRGGYGGKRGGSRGGIALTNVPIGAPPRMLLAGGVGSRGGLRGTNSDPHLRKSREGGDSGRGGATSSRPATVAAIGEKQRAKEASMEPVKPAAREEVSVQALRLTLRSMADHSDTAQVQEYGCGTLYNLALSSKEMNARIMQEGGVPIILQAMRSHPHQAGVQLNACALVKELADFQPSMQQLAHGGTGVLLKKVLENHEFNDELCARATDAQRFFPE